MRMTHIRKILVATDFSEDSEEATRYAVELGRALDGGVTLFHACQPQVYPTPDAGVIMVGPELIASLVEAARAALHEAAPRAAAALGRPVATELGEGAPTDCILRAAVDGGFDLIVMGTHGRTGLRHLLLGSVAEHVVRHSSIPVMTVHAARHARRRTAA
jgi:nucleotide-binding universal stress UspA family protein